MITALRVKIPGGSAIGEPHNILRLRLGAQSDSIANVGEKSPRLLAEGKKQFALLNKTSPQGKLVKGSLIHWGIVTSD